jgi:hypothetical protein
MAVTRYSSQKIKVFVGRIEFLNPNTSRQANPREAILIITMICSATRAKTTVRSDEEQAIPCITFVFKIAERKVVLISQLTFDLGMYEIAIDSDGGVFAR